MFAYSLILYSSLSLHVFVACIPSTAIAWAINVQFDAIGIDTSDQIAYGEREGWRVSYHLFDFLPLTDDSHQNLESLDNLASDVKTASPFSIHFRSFSRFPF